MAPRDDGQTRRAEDSLSWKLPFGLGTLRATGSGVVVVVLLLGIGGLVLYHIKQAEQNSAAIIGAVQEMAYVLTLSEAERKALKLTMPDSLRFRLLRDERASGGRP